MLNKKNLAIVFMGASVTISSGAMEQISVQQPQAIPLVCLFNQLRSLQGKNNPNENNRSVSAASAIVQEKSGWGKDQWNEIFKAAQGGEKVLATGLGKQYERFLTEDTFESILKSFIEPSHLRVVAYMQNVYGDGNPLAYNGNGKSAQKKNDVELGVYINNDDTSIIITRYSFLDGLLKKMHSLHGQGVQTALYKNIVENIKIAQMDILTVRVPNNLLGFTTYVQTLIQDNNVEALVEINNAIEKLLNPRK